MMPEWVTDYIGIPFVSCGRDRFGCDCYGLLRLVQKERFEIDLPELSNNYTDACNTSQTKDLFQDFLPKLVERIPDPEIGSVVVMLARGFATHLGTYVGDGLMLTTEYVPGSSYLQRFGFLDTKSRIEGFYCVKNNR